MARGQSILVMVSVLWLTFQPPTPVLAVPNYSFEDFHQSREAHLDQYEGGLGEGGTGWKKPDQESFTWFPYKTPGKWGGEGKPFHWKDSNDPDCEPLTHTPEPATLLLLGTALAGASMAARRRRPD